MSEYVSFCPECGVPLLDGCHIFQVTGQHLMERLQDRRVATALADWFIGLNCYCRVCNKEEHPFARLTRDEVIEFLVSPAGALETSLMLTGVQNNVDTMLRHKE